MQPLNVPIFDQVPVKVTGFIQGPPGPPGASADVLSAPTTISSNTTLISGSPNNIWANSSSISLTLVLPDATTVAGDTWRIVKSASANLVHATTTGGQTINGLSSFTLYDQWELLQVTSQNGNWLIT